PQCQSETGSITVQFSLVNDRSFVSVHKLHWIFYGNDVICVGLVNTVKIAAMVDDFPEPVGPVTSTIPLFKSAISASCGGSLSSSKLGIPLGMARITMA